MNAITVFLVASIVGYFVVLVILLDALAQARRKAKRLEVLGQRMRQAGQVVVSGYEMAMTYHNSSDWSATTRAIDDLRLEIRQWGDEVDEQPKQ